MIKSIFVDPLKIEGIEKSGVNYLIVVVNGLDELIWQKLKSLGAVLSISIGALDHGGCPANPTALTKLLERIEEALKFKPEEIWLDHFRFDGHWEAIEGSLIPGLHQDCPWCKGKNRVKVLADLAKDVMDQVNGKAKVGYFAVPFKSEEVPQLVDSLGQDHTVIGKIFDLSSPMLYHRMIKKPVSYISEYVGWIYSKTGKPVLPIIQIKDMPDSLEDKLLEEEITQAFDNASKLPSSGVSIFYWTHALEKGKTILISQLFSQK